MAWLIERGNRWPRFPMAQQARPADRPIARPQPFTPSARSTRILKPMLRTAVACLCSAILASCAELGHPSRDGPPTQASESSSAEDVPESSPGILSKKEIVSAQWMTRDFTEKIDAAPSGSDVGLWVKTRNYKLGEIITVVVGEEVDGLSVGDRRFSGAVDSQGNVRMLVDTSHSGEAMDEAKFHRNDVD